MDIWKWVMEAETELRRTGNVRLARLIRRLPSYVCEDDHARVDAILPEAIALARGCGNPWIELFIRHWGLQSRVLHRLQAGDSLTEAVALVELAHRDENRGCPQSVCTTQDLAACYAAFDGPGYAEERLQVAREGLGRITPDWPCFSCISTEYANALIDSGRAGEALDFLGEQVAALERTGDRFQQRRGLDAGRIEALLRLDRPTDALERIDQTEPHLTDEHQRARLRIARARALAALGRADEAIAHLLPFEEVRQTPAFFDAWIRAVEALSTRGTLPNDWRLDAMLFDLQRRLVANGVNRVAFEAALVRARLALARGRVPTARACLEEAEHAATRLRAALDAPERLAEVGAEVSAREAATPPLPATADELMESLDDDPESNLERLLAGRAAWPDDPDVAIALAQALRALGRAEPALDVLREWHDVHPETEAAWLLLGHTLLDDGRLDELFDRTNAVLEAPPNAEIEHQARFFAARAHRERAELREACAHLEAILAQNPDAVNTRLMLASLLFERDELEASLGQLDHLVETVGEPSGPWDWDRMVVGTLLGRWDVVRHSAGRVGIEVDGEGPIDKRWGPVRIRFSADDGGTTDLTAVRTGPVTARVVEIDRPGPVCRYHDVVTFEASPLLEPPEDEAARREWVPLFRYLRQVEPGGYRTFAIDGVHPGDDPWRTVIEALPEGCAVQKISGAQYRLAPPNAPEGDDDSRLTGIYAWLAIPPEVEIEAVRASLNASAGPLEHPLLWRDLAAALELTDEVAHQEATAEAWGIRLD